VAALVTGRLLGAAGPTRHDRAAIAWSVAQLALATPDLRTETRDLAASIVQAEAEAAKPGVPQQRQRGRQVRRHLLRWLTR
jgi:hypothetical protein